MKLVERSIMKEYKPRMKKLTYSQGKLLIKLIYRESNSSGYELIQAFLGPVRAGFYQAFACSFRCQSEKEIRPRGYRPSYRACRTDGGGRTNLNH